MFKQFWGYGTSVLDWSLLCGHPKRLLTVVRISALQIDLGSRHHVDHSVAIQGSWETFSRWIMTCWNAWPSLRLFAEITLRFQSCSNKISFRSTGQTHRSFCGWRNILYSWRNRQFVDKPIVQQNNTYKFYIGALWARRRFKLQIHDSYLTYRGARPLHPYSIPTSLTWFCIFNIVCDYLGSGLFPPDPVWLPSHSYSSEGPPKNRIKTACRTCSHGEVIKRDLLAIWRTECVYTSWSICHLTDLEHTDQKIGSTPGASALRQKVTGYRKKSSAPSRFAGTNNLLCGWSLRISQPVASTNIACLGTLRRGP